MQLRLPWILSRRRLLAAVILDSFLFAFLYNFLFLSRFGRWPDGSISLLILWAVWVLSSYVLGRYQGVDSFPGHASIFHVLQGFVKTVLVVCFSVAGIVIYLWISKNIIGNLFFSSILIPYLLFLGFFSLIAQVILGAWVRNKQFGIDKWYFLGSENAYRRLVYHLRWSRLPVDLNFLPRDKIKGLTSVPIVVDQISAENPTTIQYLLDLANSGRTVICRQEWCEVILQRFPPEYLNDADLLRGDFSLPRGTFEFRLKRMGDVLLSSVLLLLSSPILFIFGMLIKIQDGGPIFYSQVRTGLDGIPYTIWKLRTMRVDAERHGPQWVAPIDSRITFIGSVLRQTRIDELPQLWNVFTGRMSLIGPRPERPEFDHEFEQQIPHYSLRHIMRPGLSGWAQVNYPYGASVEDATNKLSYDLYYLRNFSFWLDLLILFKTIRLVFNAQGSSPIPRNPTSLNNFQD